MAHDEVAAGRPVLFRNATVLTMNDEHSVLTGGDVLVVDDRVAQGRAPGAGVVPARPLDLDHLGSEVGVQHGGVRTGEDAGEVRDQQSGQGAAGLLPSRHSPCLLAVRSLYGRSSAASLLWAEKPCQRQPCGPAPSS